MERKTLVQVQASLMQPHALFEPMLAFDLTQVGASKARCLALTSNSYDSTCYDDTSQLSEKGFHTYIILHLPTTTPNRKVCMSLKSKISKIFEHAHITWHEALPMRPTAKAGC